MKITKFGDGSGKISIICSYPYSEYGNSTTQVYEKDIQTACRLFDMNCIGATIMRDNLVAKEKYKKGKWRTVTGKLFRFSVLPEHADIFSEELFTLMR